MFSFLLLVTALLIVASLVIAFDGSRDAFHPLVFIGGMLLFLYAWMPFTLARRDGLERFFTPEQLVSVQTLNLLGVLAFCAASLAVGVRVRRHQAARFTLTPRSADRLLVGASVSGLIGLVCWLITIVNVGGFVQAFSNSYSGGQDDSGYIRDGSLLLLVGVLLAVTVLSAGYRRLLSLALALFFGLPWLASALLTGRRGPTFALTLVVLMGFYLNRSKRPPLLAVAAGGLCLGWFVLFLVTNRSQLHLGSDFAVQTDVSQMVDKPDTGNEYIYGTGTVLSSERRDHYFWMRRYLAQVLVRPIPRSVWPTKYEDFGVPELLYNAGTGEGFGETLGWVGAVGSAPGVIADLWVEVWWLAVPLMGLLGWAYAFVWKRSVTRGGPWSTQFAILSALSIYLVMQTMEAVIFRTLMLSLPCWLSWKYALHTQPALPAARPSRIRHLELRPTAPRNAAARPSALRPAPARPALKEARNG